MPRFFVHVRGASNELSRDELGLDFPDTETACREVSRAVGEIRRELVAQGRNPLDYAVEVVNASDKLVFVLSFSGTRRHHDAAAPFATSAWERAAAILRPGPDRAGRIEFAGEGAGPPGKLRPH